MLGSIEFYVVAAFVAAAVIGIVAMPKSRGEVRTFLYAGELDSSACDTEPSVVAHVDNHGRLEIYRYGLEGVGMAGAFSLAVKINGFDVTIEERLTTGHMSAGEAAMGYACIDCLGPERYHIQYRSEATGRNAAFSLNIKPGNEITRLLS